MVKIIRSEIMKVTYTAAFLAASLTTIFAMDKDLRENEELGKENNTIV